MPFFIHDVKRISELFFVVFIRIIKFMPWKQFGVSSNLCELSDTALPQPSGRDVGDGISSISGKILFCKVDTS